MRQTPDAVKESAAPSRLPPRSAGRTASPPFCWALQCRRCSCLCSWDCRWPKPSARVFDSRSCNLSGRWPGETAAAASRPIADCTARDSLVPRLQQRGLVRLLAFFADRSRAAVARLTDRAATAVSPGNHSRHQRAGQVNLGVSCWPRLTHLDAVRAATSHTPKCYQAGRLF